MLASARASGTVVAHVCVRVVHMLHRGGCGELKAEGGSALQSACHRAGQQHGLPSWGCVFLAEPCLPSASRDGAMEGHGCHLLVETWWWLTQSIAWTLARAHVNLFAFALDDALDWGRSR